VLGPGYIELSSYRSLQKSTENIKKQNIFEIGLKPGPDGLAGNRKLNMRTETCDGWPKLASFIASSRKSQKPHFEATGIVPLCPCPVFHWLLGCYNNEWTSLHLHSLRLASGQTVKELLKSSQVKASAREAY